MTTDPDPDRQGTHWATVAPAGGRRHWQCAVAEAERQAARAEAAEVRLVVVPVDEIAGLLRAAEFVGLNLLRNCEKMTGGMVTIRQWLTQQSEVQG